MKNTTNIGNVGYAKVVAKFTELQIPIYTPFGEGYTADLIAEFNGRLNKIQVKTTECLHDDSYMYWRITKQEGFHGNRVKYTSNEVDYFALYCIETDVLCLVPFDRAQGSVIQIRLDSYTGRRYKTMHFVSDYTFEKILSNQDGT